LVHARLIAASAMRHVATEARFAAAGGEPITIVETWIASRDHTAAIDTARAAVAHDASVVAETAVLQVASEIGLTVRRHAITVALPGWTHRHLTGTAGTNLKGRVAGDGATSTMNGIGLGARLATVRRIAVAIRIASLARRGAYP